jgi:hypothetical protein
MSTKIKGRTFTDGGKYFGRIWSGDLEEIGPTEPDSIICRRIADYPNATPPAAAARSTCATCHAPIAYNPAGPWPNKPRICMQCGGIEPLPIN